jgi:hypothetical protein
VPPTARNELTTNSSGVLNFARARATDQNSGVETMARTTSRIEPLLRFHAATPASIVAAGGSSLTRRWHSCVVMWSIVAG